MNSYETLSIKQLDIVEKNLLKQIEKLRSERKSRVKDSESRVKDSESTLSSVFKISLFSSKKEDKDNNKNIEKAEKPVKEKVEKPVKEKAEKAEKPVKEKAEKKEKKSSDDDDDKKPRAIKATIPSMKEVLDYHHVDYPSNAKKEDLAKLLRENNLVREAEKKESNKKEDK